MNDRLRRYVAAFLSGMAKARGKAKAFGKESRLSSMLQVRFALWDEVTSAVVRVVKLIYRYRYPTLQNEMLGSPNRATSMSNSMPHTIYRH